ncbi:MAG: hypothetical protein A2293_09850 [Elusimicrobia bacterium RIFOXYB2_FULL_49_7]|nr:MAG: hypothetical protein A2293_09850 [Elusimicrobia bacterium RIFOXYB2_FULL_49_7]
MWIQSGSNCYFRKKERPIKDKLFSTKNFVVLALGLISLIVGYLCLSRGPEDNPLSLTIAPILLVLGYCILIPVAIMFKGKKKEKA